MKLYDFLTEKTKPEQIVEIYRNDEKIAMCETSTTSKPIAWMDSILLEKEVVSSTSERVKISRNDEQYIYFQTWIRVNVGY